MLIQFRCTTKRGAKNRLIYDPSLSQSKVLLAKLNTNLVDFGSEICSESLEVIASLTSIGAGYGILPSRVAAKYENLKKLVNAPAIKDEICLIYRPEKHNNKVSKGIIQILKNAKI